MDDDESVIEATVTHTAGGIVTSWVTVATTIDPDGSEALNIATSAGMAQWSQLGLLEFAKGVVAEMRE